MLASFKQTAKNTASNKQSASQSPKQQQQSQIQHARKRPHPTHGNAKPAPYFPSMHHQNRQKKGGFEFELSFLVIGAQKAGTSWLHTLLQKCNNLSLPTEQKEVHFWDWHYRKGFDWYVRQFQHQTSSLSGSEGEANTNSLLSGEITPCYVVLNPATIAEIHKCFPNLKIIFVARDLVDRAWSAMIMELRDQTMGLNAGEFAKGTAAAFATKKQQESSSKRARMGNERNEQGKQNMSMVQQRRLQQQSSPSSQTDSYYLERLKSETHTSRSDYATHLNNWYNVYPSENILIIDYEDIERNPRSVLFKIVMHVGVEEKDAQAYVDQLKDEDVRQRINAATNNEGKSDSMTQNKTATMSSEHSLSERPRLRRQMEQYLKPHATKFNSVLKEKGYEWKLNDYIG